MAFPPSDLPDVPINRHRQFPLRLSHRPCHGTFVTYMAFPQPTPPSLPALLLRHDHGWTEHGSWRCAVLGGRSMRPTYDDPGRPDWRTALLLGGSGLAGDMPGELGSMTPGTCFIRYPGQRHRLIRHDTSTWLEFVLMLGPGMLERLLELGVLRREERWWRGQLGPEVVDGVQRCLAPAPDAAQSLARLCQLISALRSRDLPRTDPRLERARRLLAQPDGPPISTIADLLNMGESTFRAWFGSGAGVSPVAYRIQSRIAAARDLLMDPDLPVAEVAARLGYTDAFAFSRQFRQATGLSPNRWRHR